MSLQSYLKQFEPGHFLEAASDFHFLVYITSIDLVPIKENIKHLIDAIKAKDMLQAYHWREEQPWATLEQLLQENVTGLTSSDEWTCKQCTYINQGRLVCDMCGYPKD
ncbi:hypothetical protein QYM36_007417 [Artemia franciscana]|uniref:Nuclear pore localisation protein NPL4 C-terminal domain-containing protein n=2 Tax=Artemia franciscana TaxID=6661 RepID=A0AA88L3A3_ARTSF|nr:hypothetical protein QYM36_007417 [Artemia franciscana]